MGQTCYECDGDMKCRLCDGTGSMKENVSHPSPWDVDEDGNVDCTACDGTGDCPRCDGSGEIDDDD